jgi:hypothetical protein
MHDPLTTGPCRDRIGNFPHSFGRQLLPDANLSSLLKARAHAGRFVRLVPETALPLAAKLELVIGADRKPPKRPASGDEMCFAVEKWPIDNNHLGMVTFRKSAALQPL